MRRRVRCEAMAKGQRCNNKAKWYIPTWYGTRMIAACEKCAPEHGAPDWRRRKQPIE